MSEMPDPIEVAKPLTDGNNRQVEVSKGLTATLNGTGNVSLILGVNDPGEGIETTFRIGKALLGIWTLKDALPTILLRIIPGPTAVQKIEGSETLDIRARCGLNLLQFKASRREKFLQVGDTPRNYKLMVYLVDTDPPGADENLVMGDSERAGTEAPNETPKERRPEAGAEVQLKRRCF
jgi:hypothetical protein